MSIKSTRVSRYTWEFVQSKDTPLYEAGEEYHRIDKLMYEEKLIPIETWFRTQDDGTLILNETYANR